MDPMWAHERGHRSSTDRRPQLRSFSDRQTAVSSKRKKGDPHALLVVAVRIRELKKKESRRTKASPPRSLSLPLPLPPSLSLSPQIHQLKLNPDFSVDGGGGRAELCRVQ
ncbi:hypothetical protein SAY87_020806 [Trapa incisa]|uniref:Uncharacterized protein n=1 Tax=Trapa incisa TaxID=236973 RepID=A0AAN7JR78_9MYRT|nr:hypothetical protein SAY87_020806 [Trapa incisa]